MMVRWIGCIGEWGNINEDRDIKRSKNFDLLILVYK